jgi:hypothetical protein
MAVNAEQNQEYNQNQQANQGEQAQSTGGGAAQTQGPAQGGNAPASRVANYSSGQQAGTTGSGRFTNLQKYIGANQGAGDRLASGITKDITQENQPKEKEAQTSATAVRDGLAAAQNKVNTGQGYQQQLESNNFNAKDLASDPNKVQEFNQYRTGSAIDEALLAKQNQAAQTNYLNYQNQVQNQLNQTASDTGRYQLLKNAYGGGTAYQNPYSTGQQRLDQLFLQSGGNNGIGQLQNNLRNNIQGVNSQVADLTGNVNTGVNNAISKEAEIANALQTGITGKTNTFVNDIAGTEGDVNKKRAEDQKFINDNYTALQNGGEIDQRFADMLGLTNGQHLYNSLSDKNANSLFDFGPAELHGADQLASGDQRSYYNALAQLSGIDPTNYAINGNTQVNGAVTNKNALADMLNQSQTGWNQFVNGGNYVANGFNAQGQGGGGFEGGTSSIGASGNISKAQIAQALEALGPNATSNDIYNYLNNGGVNVGIDSSHAFGDKEASRAASEEARRQVIASLAGQSGTDFGAQGFFKRARIKTPGQESGGQFGVT